MPARDGVKWGVGELFPDLTRCGNNLAPIKPAERPLIKRLGSYYTVDLAADFIARWAIRGPQDRVLEPCFGGGAFLRAIRRTCLEKDLQEIRLIGVELAEEAFSSALSSGALSRQSAIKGDFLNVNPFHVDAVIGNPPYVRLRHLSPSQADHAMRVARQALGEQMQSSGSLWMPFVLHALQFLGRGGRLAFVLPYDMTYVRYARPLWHHLGKHFTSLGVVRVRERLFPDVMQDVVILCAEDFGGTTQRVRFRAFERKSDLISGSASADVELPLNAVVSGDRPFLRALLSDDLRNLLDEKLGELTQPIRDICSFSIGYVSAHKEFFHPAPKVIDAFRIPSSSLRATVTSSRQLNGVGVFTSSVEKASQEFLFYPSAQSEKLSPGEHGYVRYGEKLGVHDRYKCRKRCPWYKVPDVRVPDLILSVFGERPIMLLNDRGLVATNSLLCGFVRRSSPESLLGAWYTSLALLYCELHVHSLGGGVLVLVPGEAGTIRVPRLEGVGRKYVRELHRAVSRHGVERAYALGDGAILKRKLGLNSFEIDLIRRGILQLRRWRARNGREPTESLKYIDEQSPALERADHALHEGRYP